MKLPAPLRRFAGSAVGTYLAYVAHGLRHPSLLRSSATEHERRSPMPGDELVGAPDWVTDFATTIEARPDEIWPWLAQMGYGRCGYYTWYRYDNGGVGSSDIIVPELQRLNVGDIIPDGPQAHEGYGVWRVVELERARSLVLFSRRHPKTGRELDAGEDGTCLACSWVFALEPTGAAAGTIDARRTRLHVRVRAHLDGASRLTGALARAFFGLGDAVMENTLIDGIRERAEQLARSRA